MLLSQNSPRNESDKRAFVGFHVYFHFWQDVEGVALLCGASVALLEFSHMISSLPCTPAPFLFMELILPNLRLPELIP